MASDEKKPKRRHQIGVSTNVEKAWYVAPDLMAGRGDEPSQEVIDADSPGRDDATVTIGDSDLQTADIPLEGSDEGARHYKDVSLRGALLAPGDADAATAADKDTEATKPSTPPPPPIEKRACTPDAGKPSVEKPAAGVGGFDLSKFPPIWLAAVAFALGVVTTLIGVLIAL